MCGAGAGGGRVRGWGAWEGSGQARWVGWRAAHCGGGGTVGWGCGLGGGGVCGWWWGKGVARRAWRGEEVGKSLGVWAVDRAGRPHQPRMQGKGVAGRLPWNTAWRVWRVRDRRWRGKTPRRHTRWQGNPECLLHPPQEDSVLTRPATPAPVGGVRGWELSLPLRTPAPPAVPISACPAHPRRAPTPCQACQRTHPPPFVRRRTPDTGREDGAHAWRVALRTRWAGLPRKRLDATYWWKARGGLGGHTPSHPDPTEWTRLRPGASHPPPWRVRGSPGPWETRVPEDATPPKWTDRLQGGRALPRSPLPPLPRKGGWAAETPPHDPSSPVAEVLQHAIGGGKGEGAILPPPPPS